MMAVDNTSTRSADRPSHIDIVDCEFIHAALGSNVNVRTDLNSSFWISSEELGRGANAAAHRALPRAMGESDGDGIEEGFVVKFFDAATDNAAKQLELITKEVSMLAAVQPHPNIVGFHGFFLRTPGECPWPNGASHALMMDCCGGGDLQEFIAKGKHPVCEARASELVYSLLSALSHVHAQGIVHRDVKAENVLLKCAGQPMLADFGLACHRSDSVEMSRRCGSPGYVAPEVVLGKQYDEKVDVFGVGVILYFLVQCKLPFHGPDLMSTFRRTARCIVKFESSPAHEALSGNCKSCVFSLLSRKPEDRPDSATAQMHLWFQSAELRAESAARARWYARDTTVRSSRGSASSTLSSELQCSVFSSECSTEVPGDRRSHKQHSKVQFKKIPHIRRRLLAALNANGSEDVSGDCGMDPELLDDMLGGSTPRDSSQNNRSSEASQDSIYRRTYEELPEPPLVSPSSRPSSKPFCRRVWPLCDRDSGRTTGDSSDSRTVSTKNSSEPISQTQDENSSVAVDDGFWCSAPAERSSKHMQWRLRKAGTPTGGHFRRFLPAGTSGYSSQQDPTHGMCDPEEPSRPSV